MKTEQISVVEPSVCYFTQKTFLFCAVSFWRQYNKFLHSKIFGSTLTSRNAQVPPKSFVEHEFLKLIFIFRKIKSVFENTSDGTTHRQNKGRCTYKKCTSVVITEVEIFLDKTHKNGCAQCTTSNMTGRRGQCEGAQSGNTDITKVRRSHRKRDTI